MEKSNSSSGSSSNSQEQEEQREVEKPRPARAAKKYWNPASYKNYIKYPAPSAPQKLTTGSRISNRQAKTLYLVSTAFKIAKIVAVVLIALFLIGEF